MIFMSDSNLRHGTYSAPDAGVVGILVYSIFAMLVSLPQVIITNRLVFSIRLVRFQLTYKNRFLVQLQHPTSCRT
jgi:hypothetical protein